MHDNELDSVFKNKLKGISNVPGKMSWNIENSWLRLQKKRRRKVLNTFYYYGAAILLVGFLLGQIINYGEYRNARKNTVEYSISEYQNREKLKEIEARMSGNYYSIKICSVCEDIFYQSVKVDRPVQFRYFQIN